MKSYIAMLLLCCTLCCGQAVDTAGQEPSKEGFKLLLPEESELSPDEKVEKLEAKLAFRLSAMRKRIEALEEGMPPGMVIRHGTVEMVFDKGKSVASARVECDMRGLKEWPTIVVSESHVGGSRVVPKSERLYRGGFDITGVRHSLSLKETYRTRISWVLVGEKIEEAAPAAQPARK